MKPKPIFIALGLIAKVTEVAIPATIRVLTGAWFIHVGLDYFVPRTGLAVSYRDSLAISLTIMGILFVTSAMRKA